MQPQMWRVYLTPQRVLGSGQCSPFVTCLSDPIKCAWFGTMQPHLWRVYLTPQRVLGSGQCSPTPFVTCLSDPTKCTWFGTMQPHLWCLYLTPQRVLGSGQCSPICDVFIWPHNVCLVRDNAAPFVTCLSDPTTCAWLEQCSPICDVFIWPHNVCLVRNNAAPFVTCLSDPTTCAWFGTMQPHLWRVYLTPQRVFGSGQCSPICDVFIWPHNVCLVRDNAAPFVTCLCDLTTCKRFGSL